MNYDIYSSKERESVLFEFTGNFCDDPAGKLFRKSERRAF